MSNRNDILKQLKEDILIHIDPSNTSAGGRRYLTHPVEVRRGVYGSGDFNYKPVICFTLIRDEEVNEFGGDGLRKLHIYMYGYVDTKTYKSDDDAYNDVHNLVDDIEEFLYNDFTYSNDTQIGEIVIHEAGVKYNLAWYEMTLTITYSYII